MLSRERALELIHAQNPDEHLINHALQSEAIMRGLARHFGEDEELWGMSGLLHDIDFPKTKDDPAQHGLMALDLLKEEDFPEEALYAISAHNTEGTNVEPKSKLDYALRAAETATGLISANALVRPDGMTGMKPKSLKKKMKEKAFAANVDRDRIRECEKINLPLDAFFQIGIDCMQDLVK